ncbi:MAG: hypothetical protein AB1728_10765 [Bacteroidota bacterium]
MRILFVCTANITRSAMCEAILKKFVSDDNLHNKITIESAGTEAISGGSPDPETIEVCKKYGIDVSNHLARQVEPDLLDQADLILCLAESHKERIIDASPAYEKKVFMLKEYAQVVLPADLSVDDPTGKAKKKYQETFEELYGEILRIYPAIKREAKT